MAERLKNLLLVLLLALMGVLLALTFFVGIQGSRGGQRLLQSLEDQDSFVLSETVRPAAHPEKLAVLQEKEQLMLSAFLGLLLLGMAGILMAIGTAGADAFSGATGSDSADTDTYVDGISGATVTSKAIARCVNSAVSYVTGADIDSGATSWGG